MKMDKHLQGPTVVLCALILIGGCQPRQVSTPPGTAVESQPLVQPPRTVQKTSSQTQTADVPVDAPQVKLENPSVDLKQVGPGSSTTAEYQFSNVGEKPLVIDHIQSTCGCTVPQLDKKEYAHGESGVIKVVFTAPSVKGSVVKHLYIVSNDPRNPRYEFEIKAEVVVKMDISPESVELRFDRPNAGMPELTVRSLDNREFAIRSVSVPNDVMKIPFDPAQKAASFVLKAEVDTKLLDTYSTGAIQIATDHPQSGTLLVRYTALPFVEVNRPRIILQNVEPGVPVVKDVLLRSNYDKPIEIVSSESKNGYMQILSDEKDGNHRNLMVQITPPDQSTSARRYITDELTLALKTGEQVTIRCSGWFKL